MTSLDDRLKDADPARGFSDADFSPQVLAMWERAQSGTPGRPRRKRWRVAIPVIALAVVTTGGAIAVPMTMRIGEQGTIVEPDAHIPINYTTLSGTDVFCSYRVYLGDDVRTTRDGEVAAVLGNTDWTGVGQDIYDHAISNPRGPVDGEPRSSQTSESTFCGTSRAAPLKKTFPTCSTTPSASCGNDGCTGMTSRSLRPPP